MLGLGETDDQILLALGDLKKAGVSFVTLGQYLTPRQGYHPVKKYYHPDEFREWKKTALSLGFTHAESGPLVRSSYRAEEALK